MTWWNDDYQKRIQLTVSAAAGNGVSAGYSVKFNPTGADALEIYEDCLANGNDFRIVYWNGSSWVELDRDLVAFTSSNIEVWFKLQVAIDGGESDDNYYAYYSNPGAGSPPADKANVYRLWDDFEDGNADGWTSGGSAVLEVGANYKKNGNYGLRVRTSYANGSAWYTTPVGTDGYCYEVWFRVEAASGHDRGGILWANAHSDYNWALFFYCDTNALRIRINGTNTNTSYACSSGVWYLVRIERVPGGNVRAYVNNQLIFDKEQSGSPGQYIGCWVISGDYCHYDDFKVRLLVATEPTVSGGEEESPITARPYSFIV